MFEDVSSTYIPSNDATPKQFRISGIILLVSAVAVAAVFVAALVQYGLVHLLPISMLPVFLLWFMGMHRVLWGGTVAQTRRRGAARAALTGGVGLISLLAGSALVGFLLA
jgi:hypothetical protein